MYYVRRSDVICELIFSLFYSTGQTELDLLAIAEFFVFNDDNVRVSFLHKTKKLSTQYGNEVRMFAELYCLDHGLDSSWTILLDKIYKMPKSCILTFAV